MKKLIVALLVVMSTSAMAQRESIDLRGLTSEQKEKLALIRAEMQSPVSASERLREEANKWGKLGENVGKATVAAAKEVGVAANEFVSTPLGKIVTGIVIYKVIGTEALKIIVGAFIMFFFFSIGLWFIFRRPVNVTYENVPVLYGMWNRRLVKSQKAADELGEARYFFAAICAGAGLIFGLSLMF